MSVFSLRWLAIGLAGVLIGAPTAWAGPSAAGGTLSCNADADNGSATTDLVFTNPGAASERVNLCNGDCSTPQFFPNANIWDAIACDTAGSKAIFADAPAQGASRILTFTADASGIASTAFVATGGGIWALRFVADVNGDGNKDLVYEGVGGSAVGLVRINLVSGGSITGAPFFVPAAFGPPVGKGDFNGDGIDDIVYDGNGSHRIDLMDADNNPGTGRIQSLFIADGGNAWEIRAIGDASGDGKDDLWWLGVSGAATNIARLQRIEDGVVQETAFPPTGGGAILPFAIVDSNGDGVGDLVSAGASTNRLDLMDGSFSITDTKFFGNGGGTYTPTVTGDFNGDGNLDVASQGPNDALVQLLDGDTAQVVVGTVNVPNAAGAWELNEF